MLLVRLQSWSKFGPTSPLSARDSLSLMSRDSRSDMQPRHVCPHLPEKDTSVRSRSESFPSLASGYSPSSSTTSLLMGSCQNLNTQGNELRSPPLPNRTLRREFTRIALIAELSHKFSMFTHIFLSRYYKCVILLGVKKQYKCEYSVTSCKINGKLQNKVFLENKLKEFSIFNVFLYKKILYMLSIFISNY